jgi:hypothetical protein
MSATANETMGLLQEIRAKAGERCTMGLTDAQIESFLASDPEMTRAIRNAHAMHAEAQETWGEQMQMPEEELTRELQADFVNFYPAPAISPYVPIARAPDHGS